MPYSSEVLSFAVSILQCARRIFPSKNPGHDVRVAYVYREHTRRLLPESLTDHALEAQAEDYFRQIRGMGVVAGIERGFFQREIARAAYRYQQEMEKKQRVDRVVNEYVEPDEKLEIPILYIGEEAENEQRRGLAELRAARATRRRARTRWGTTCRGAHEARRGELDGEDPRLRPRLRHRRRSATRCARVLATTSRARSSEAGVEASPSPRVIGESRPAGRTRDCGSRRRRSHEARLRRRVHPSPRLRPGRLLRSDSNTTSPATPEADDFPAEALAITSDGLRSCRDAHGVKVLPASDARGVRGAARRPPALGAPAEHGSYEDAEVPERCPRHELRAVGRGSRGRAREARGAPDLDPWRLEGLGREHEMVMWSFETEEAARTALGLLEERVVRPRRDSDGDPIPVGAEDWLVAERNIVETIGGAGHARRRGARRPGEAPVSFDFEAGFFR